MYVITDITWWWQLFLTVNFIKDIHLCCTPFEWQKLTNSCGKLFAGENLAALLSSDFANPKTKRRKGNPENLERPWLGDLEKDVASEGAGKVWGGYDMRWHLFSTGGDTNVLRCQLYKCLVCTDRHTALEDKRMIDLSLHSRTFLPLLEHWVNMCQIVTAPEEAGQWDLCQGL